ncbi:MAG: hypothetical protein AVDCRST_MAG96-14 [uncultured Segetibacter sp.]|uniref:Uncharacterized protein n=1 Tax=uncultured Segetibacter sp. TaxID=481133 RepID=A0A6J4RF01_9BACT|nr:MAG: hypothetical protein AVDCRST_MAG96-14 [uncultured Segetibacter sp.]
MKAPKKILEKRIWWSVEDLVQSNELLLVNSEMLPLVTARRAEFEKSERCGVMLWKGSGIYHGLAR